MESCPSCPQKADERPTRHSLATLFVEPVLKGGPRNTESEVSDLFLRNP